MVLYVDRSANKIEIKKAVEETYGVTVDSVRTMVCIGKKELEELNLVLFLENKTFKSNCFFVGR